MDENLPITVGTRRNEDIALDMMKFIAMTTGYGKTAVGRAGFQDTSSSSKPDEYAKHLLDLYKQCLSAIVGGK